MAIKRLSVNKQANESISKYKLLSAYGGPGSIIHTQYGSIIISCIEEWGFLNQIIALRNEAISLGDKDVDEYVIKHAKLSRNGNIGISNDTRLLHALIRRKGLTELQYLVLIPEIDLKDFDNTVKGGQEIVKFTIPSTFMPKIFSDKSRLHKHYVEWFNDWEVANKEEDKYKWRNLFFPPKKINTKVNKDDKKSWVEELTQDNIVLICEHGHISDFPWSEFLRWKVDNPSGKSSSAINLFNSQPCCGTKEKPTAKIKITSSSANASGFDGKWLKCDNCTKQTSLKGLMSIEISCVGHKPWESGTGNEKYYSGDSNSRKKNPPFERCRSERPMKVALTTGNNLYFSRVLSSIYMPDELFISPIKLEIANLEIEKQKAKDEDRLVEAIEINDKIKALQSKIEETDESSIPDSIHEIQFRFQEYSALCEKTEKEINVEEKFLKVKDVTKNLDTDLKLFFSRLLRVDNMKITSAQLDFSRVSPIDGDANPEILTSKNIFRERPSQVQVYPVVENYGEGIFFSFNELFFDSYANDYKHLVDEYRGKFNKLLQESNDFSIGAIQYALHNNWQLYLVHTFSHLIMRELEFRCGYPTASLSERLYVSNEDEFRMYGCMIYTAEGAEGSMGGLIAQTRESNLNNLIKSALKRATICHSDPLCWESEGQGLFDLNFASCFSCSLVSETSCEERNVYLDRRVLVDEKYGFFKDVINKI